MAVDRAPHATSRTAHARPRDPGVLARSCPDFVAIRACLETTPRIRAHMAPYATTRTTSPMSRVALRCNCPNGGPGRTQLEPFQMRPSRSRDSGRLLAWSVGALLDAAERDYRGKYPSIEPYVHDQLAEHLSPYMRWLLECCDSAPLWAGYENGALRIWTIALPGATCFCSDRRLNRVMSSVTRTWLPVARFAPMGPGDCWSAAPAAPLVRRPLCRRAPCARRCCSCSTARCLPAHGNRSILHAAVPGRRC